VQTLKKIIMEELKPTVRDFEYCWKAIKDTKEMLLQDFNKQVDIKTAKYWETQPLEEMQKEVDRLHNLFFDLITEGRDLKIEIKNLLNYYTFSVDELKDILKQLEEKTK
jgi:hypothetical protein